MSKKRCRKNKHRRAASEASLRPPVPADCVTETPTGAYATEQIRDFLEHLRLKAELIYGGRHTSRRRGSKPGVG